MEFKDTAIQAIKEAGKILLDNLNKEKKTWLETEGKYKDYAQDVSDIDKLANEKIISIIRENFPDHNILTEESEKIEKESDYTWIIDSLDGTTQYIRGLPYFSISIALQHKDQVILGAVFNPCLNELFIAEKNKGAYLNNKKINVSNKTNSERILVASSAFGSYKLANKENIFLKVNKSIRTVRMYGSPAIDLCYVAAGKFDVRITSMTEPWDHSAGCLIIEEAGGKVTDWKGNPWSSNSTNLIASNNKVHDEILKIVSD